VNVQDLAAASASVAVHCTGVAPTGNGDPDVRLQLTCTGDTPPVVVGDGNVTDTAAPVNEMVATSAGHVIVRGGADGMVVVVVDGTVVVGVEVVVRGGVGELGDEQPVVAKSSDPISAAQTAHPAEPGKTRG
jgi:hypothetical protein